MRDDGAQDTPGASASNIARNPGGDHERVGLTPELEQARGEQLEIDLEQRRYFSQLRAATSHDELTATATRVGEPGNWATRTWRRAREALRLVRHSLGLEEEVRSLLMEYMGDLTGKRILELGCSRGSFATLELARRGQYTGIDLAENAARDLRHALEREGLGDRASVIAGDFYDAGFPDGAFDIVFAKSVLHHFKCPELVFSELARILAPGGIVVSHDPIQLNPLLASVRALYRPFQSDRSWEWPFGGTALGAARRHFRIARAEGEGALELLWMPLLVLLPHRPRLSVHHWLKGMERSIRRAVPALHYYDMRIVLRLEKLPS